MAHRPKKYGDSFTVAELMQLRCMWRLGVPTDIILAELNRLSKNTPTMVAYRRGWHRPDWYRGWLNQSLRCKSHRPMVQVTQGYQLSLCHSAQEGNDHG